METLEPYNMKSQDMVVESQNLNVQVETNNECIPQSSILEPILLSVFISNVDSAIECILRKFANDTDLSDAVDTLEEGRDAVQRDTWTG